MRYLLDTHIVVYIIKQQPPSAIERLHQVGLSEVGISTITLSELLFGVEKSSRPVQNLLALNRFLLGIAILPYDDLAAEAYGRIRAELEHRGRPVGPLDTLIAAHARSLGLTLVTHNTREFRRVSGLAVENWAR